MTKSTEAATTLRDLSELLTQISSATGLTKEQLETQFEDVRVTVYQYEDRTLVPPKEFESIIDTWAKSIKHQIRVPAKISASPKKTVAKARTARSKATAPKAARQSSTKSTAKKSTAKPVRKRATRTKSSLPLPANYKSVVSHLYGPSLKRIMPEGQAEQRSFLEAIAQESPDGVALLNELSAIIAKKYTGKMAPEAAYNGLKNKAQVLLDDISGKRKPRKVAKRKQTGPKKQRQKRT